MLTLLRKDMTFKCLYFIFAVFTDSCRVLYSQRFWQKWHELRTGHIFNNRRRENMREREEKGQLVANNIHKWRCTAHFDNMSFLFSIFVLFFFFFQCRYLNIKISSFVFCFLKNWPKWEKWKLDSIFFTPLAPYLFLFKA